MEFSFGSEKWLPRESFAEKHEGDNNYALGLHAPGFFDKVLDVKKCLLQSEPANMVFPALLVLFNDYIFLNAKHVLSSGVTFARHSS